jgi:hypothetical protein
LLEKKVSFDDWRTTEFTEFTEFDDFFDAMMEVPEFDFDSDFDFDMTEHS